MDAVAICRWCRRRLKGKPYHLGGAAYDPQTDERCPTNFYGGYVCSYGCDHKASIEQESSMPGAGSATYLSSGARASLTSNWSKS